MRIPTIAIAALLLMLPAAQQASACGTPASAQATTSELSAAAKKPAKKAMAKKKMEKVEYMRSAAGPEPVVKKTKITAKKKM